MPVAAKPIHPREPNICLPHSDEYGLLKKVLYKASVNLSLILLYLLDEGNCSLGIPGRRGALGGMML